MSTTTEAAHVPRHAAGDGGGSAGHGWGDVAAFTVSPAVRA